jgi:WD40 repeat protein
VTVAFDAWGAGHTGSTSHKVSVVAAKPGPKLEEVSARLTQELIHPNRASSLVGLRFSADGKRLVAGDEPGGVVVVWDIATGKELMTVETQGYRGSETYFSLSPDWRRLFVARTSQKIERVEQNRKRLYRFEFDGGVRQWDLTTGKFQGVLKRQPPGFILEMQLSPDASKLATLEWTPGTYEGKPPRAASLWNLQTGKSEQLPNGVDWYPTFSADGQTLAINATGADHFVQALKLFDAGSREEKLSIPIGNRNATMVSTCFSPDGRVLVGNYRVYPRTMRGGDHQCWLKWWDTATGQELASFAADQADTLAWSGFSPDGKLLAVTNWGGEKAKVFLFRVANAKPINIAILGEKSNDATLKTREPAFSPDGKWLAVITQAFPDNRGEKLAATDAPQARIHLIETATGQIRGTLISPQGFPRSACFSPDGRTLATGGYGKVLLWDMRGLTSE